MTFRPEIIALLIILAFVTLLYFAIRASRIQKAAKSHQAQSLGFQEVTSRPDALISRALVRWADRTRTDMDERLIGALHKPIFISVILIGVYVAAMILDLNTTLFRVIAGLAKRQHPAGRPALTGRRAQLIRAATRREPRRDRRRTPLPRALRVPTAPVA